MRSSVSQSEQILARAFAAHKAGDIAQAEFFYKLVLQADKKRFDALHMLGVIEAQRGNFAAGLRRLTEALRVRPSAPDALVNLGRMQGELGKSAEAITTYKKALTLDPRSALAHSNLSILLRRQRRREEALAHCQTALEIAPDYAGAWNNRGNVLYELNRPAEALESYDRALVLQPRLAAAHLGRGNVLRQLDRLQEALAAYDRVLAIEPNNAECHFGRGKAFDRLEHRSDAKEAYAKAFAIKPDLPYAEGAYLVAKMQVCEWDNLEAECAHLGGTVAQETLRSDPFNMLAASGSLAVQMKCAEHYAIEYPASMAPLWRGECYRHERIRLAYLSADFHNHATAYLVAAMFEAHDRTRFETTAVSFGPETNDEMQTRLRGAFDRFLDVRARSDREIAEVLRNLEIDIVADLKGYTGYSQPSILAQRPAPIQVSYLGYPGTLGASYIDYILADRTVIPPEHFAFYNEKIVSLPDTYQVNDAGRRIEDWAPTREELQLPNDGFVFCCFNRSYKIRPPVFDIWMRLLQQVDGSVLWMFEENAAASRNLRLEAERRGVKPERLVFAPLVPKAKHLARLRLADLFLDTLPYNAHTTASDALWAGVPVITSLGSTFAGRVAASLDRAIGLPELVTESLADYEVLALKIAQDPALCASLKDKLARNRKTFPLFDTKRFTRNIEAAYTTMWQRYQRGELPESFVVAPA